MLVLNIDKVQKSNDIAKYILNSGNSCFHLIEKMQINFPDNKTLQDITFKLLDKIWL